MHLHIGGLHALVTFLNVLIVGVFWRILSMRLRDNAIGQAMAFAY